MANDWRMIAGSPAGQNLSPSTFNYLAGHVTSVATETNAQTLIRDTLTWKNLYVRCSTFGSGATFRSRIGAANGTQLVTLTGAGAVEDTTHSDSLSTGNLVNISRDGTSSGDVVTVIATTLEHASSGVPVLQVTSWTATATNFPPIGGAGSGGTEANGQYTMRTATTLSNLKVISSGAHVIKTRINGADGTLTCTGGTGEDTTHTDSVSVGQSLNYTNTGIARSTGFLIQTKSTSNSRQMVLGGPSAGYTVGASLFFVLEGSPSAGNATESTQQVAIRQNATFANMFVRANSVTGSDAITLRQNGSNTTLTVTPTGSGVIEDTTHTVSTSTDTDTFCYGSGASANMSLFLMGVELQQYTPAAFTALGRPFGPWGQSFMQQIVGR